jgi:SOS-response transcriptional repressor LexA
MERENFFLRPIRDLRILTNGMCKQQMLPALALRRMIMQRGIDLNDQLVRNKPAIFFMRVNGNAMIGAGIYNGDVVIVDKSLNARNGSGATQTLKDHLVKRTKTKI